MEDKCRQHIKKNIDKLIGYTNYAKLMNACIGHQLIYPVMRERIENLPGTSEYDKHKEMFIKITKRGPNAYNQLKTILNFLNCDAAVKLLNQPLNDDSQFISIHNHPLKNTTNQQQQNVKQIPETSSSSSSSSSTDVLKSMTPALIKNISNDDDAISKKENIWPRLDLYSKEINPKTKRTVVKSKMIHYDSKVGHYQMTSQKNRGVFFMVNIIDFPSIAQRRNGAEEDGKSLLHLFRELGFKLFAYTNLTKDEFFYLLDSVINSEHTKDTECFVMALMTHGDMDEYMNDKVQFHDGAVIKVRDIEDRFENRKCPNLVHKPKIFLFPFCRGQVADYGHYPEMQTDNITPYNNTPTLSDILICYASIRGFKAHRDPVDGAWYIQEFCNVLSEHAHDTHFEDMIKIIQNKAGKLRTGNGAMQMASYLNYSFNKKLFLNPGIYKED